MHRTWNASNLRNTNVHTADTLPFRSTSHNSRWSVVVTRWRTWILHYMCMLMQKSVLEMKLAIFGCIHFFQPYTPALWKTLVIPTNSAVLIWTTYRTSLFFSTWIQRSHSNKYAIVFVIWRIVPAGWWCFGFNLKRR